MEPRAPGSGGGTAWPTGDRGTGQRRKELEFFYICVPVETSSGCPAI